MLSSRNADFDGFIQKRTAVAVNSSSTGYDVKMLDDVNLATLSDHA